MHIWSVTATTVKKLNFKFFSAKIKLQNENKKLFNKLVFDIKLIQFIINSAWYIKKKKIRGVIWFHFHSAKISWDIIAEAFVLNKRHRIENKFLLLSANKSQWVLENGDENRPRILMNCLLVWSIKLHCQRKKSIKRKKRVIHICPELYIKWEIYYVMRFSNQGLFADKNEIFSLVCNNHLWKLAVFFMYTKQICFKSIKWFVIF